MGLRKKKSLIDQAGDYVDQMKPHAEAAMESARDFVQDTVVPALADAREKAGPALADARDAAREAAQDAREMAAPALADAREKIGPALTDAREKAGPALADARAKAAPIVADARAKAAPVVSAAAANAAERATAVRELADAKVADLKGETPKKKGRLKKFVLLAGLAGGVAFVAKKLQGGGQSDNWQSSYTPTPAPSATGSAPASSTGAAAPAAPTVPTPPSEPPTPTGSAPQSGADDTGGASPDEALSDAAADTHPVTTPDEPAEVVDLEGDKQ